MLAYFLVSPLVPGEGHDQLVDDMYTTPDGSALVVSRPSFADVDSIDLRTGAVRWRYAVSGYRAALLSASPVVNSLAAWASPPTTFHLLNSFTGPLLLSFSCGLSP